VALNIIAHCLTRSPAMQTTNHCTSCHICRTSIKTSQRNFVPCTRCPAIVCRVCFESSVADWDVCKQDPNWTCPRCNRICPCKRCRHRSDNDKHGFFLNAVVGRRGSSLSPLPAASRGASSSASTPKRLASLPEPNSGPHFSLGMSDYGALIGMLRCTQFYNYRFVTNPIINTKTPYLSSHHHHQVDGGQSPSTLMNCASHSLVWFGSICCCLFFF
jgi:hypothetical protein